MDTIYYYEIRDGSILSTVDLDVYKAVNKNTKRIFRMNGQVLKCIQDNDNMPWGYDLSVEESMIIILSAAPENHVTAIDVDDLI